MFDTMTTEEQGLRVEVLDALVVGEQAFCLEVLTEIARLDTAGMWRADGATSMADWLTGRYAISIGSAREWVKVARALSEQPDIRSVLRRGNCPGTSCGL